VLDMKKNLIIDLIIQFDVLVYFGLFIIFY